jgi:hypothetical protein
MQERDGTKSREVIRFFVQKYPDAMRMVNNFDATPFDTVQLSIHQKPKKNATRVVMVYGVSNWE